MLSYQHVYHAGNPADVHKHAILAWMLERLTDKPKPLTYMETHAGRALYDLSVAEARKTKEAEAGVGRMLAGFDRDHPYVRAIAAARAAAGQTAYPGSPWIAAHLLREADALHLAELHPQEHAALAQAMRGAARVHHADGFALALSLCPPDPRRGLLLIDPSFEIKTDYETIPSFIGKVHRVWNVGVIALWYPILTDGRHRGMVRAIEGLDLPKLVKSEVAIPPVREGHGMIGSGMIVVNAPYGLDEEVAALTAMFARL